MNFYLNCFILGSINNLKDQLYYHWNLFKKEMSLINQINSKQYNIGNLSPEEIELLRKSKKEISDKVKEMIEKDPELFTCKSKDVC
jgi:hypothetical protein